MRTINALALARWEGGLTDRLPILERGPRPDRRVPAEPALALVLGQPAQDLVPSLAHGGVARVVCAAKGDVLEGGQPANARQIVRIPRDLDGDLVAAPPGRVLQLTA